MTISIRPVNEKDFPVIEEKTNEFFTRNQTKEWQKGFSVQAVMAAAKDQTTLSALVIEESFFVLLTYNRPWYSKQMYLQELLTYRLYPNNKSFVLVPQALEIIAKDALLDGIMVSAALYKNPEKLFKIYEAAGFERQNGFMFKTVK